MGKLLLAAASALALVGGATAASAAPVVYSSTTVNPITPPTSGIVGNTFDFATTATFPQMFTDTFVFDILTTAVTNATISTISLNGLQNINFSCPTCTIYIDSATDGNVFHLTSDGTSPGETWSLDNPLTLDPGNHTLVVTGDITAGPTASYSGTINFLTPAVPEPATWAMMLFGFAGIGMVLRRRGKPVLAQLA